MRIRRYLESISFNDVKSSQVCVGIQVQSKSDLTVLLQMLADVDGLLDEVVKILGDLRGKA